MSYRAIPENYFAFSGSLNTRKISLNLLRVLNKVVKSGLKI